MALRLSLAAHRRAGRGFNETWVASLIDALRVIDMDARDLDAWEGALDWAEPAFRRAYKSAPIGKAEESVADLAGAGVDAIIRDTPAEVLELTLDAADAGQIAA